MIEGIRGIECSLYNGRVEDLLLFISNIPFDFYVRWCMKIDDKDMILPKSLNNFKISSHDLRTLAKASIWELVLHIYPVGSNVREIETYDDFVNSSCTCCLLFYDCGLLDIYVKEAQFRKQLSNLLVSLGAKDIVSITDASDTRTRLSTSTGDGSM